MITRGLALLLFASVCRGFVPDCDKFDASTLDSNNEAHYCRYMIDSGKPPKEGEVCLAHPEDVLPTQAAYGEVDATCVKNELEDYAARKDGSLKKLLMKKQAPAVLGPHGNVYITDHHHLAVALLRAFLDYREPKHHRTLYVCVTRNLANVTDDRFWNTMIDHELTWLHDEKGQRITVQQLPTTVKNLRDDPYRTLALYMRQSYGFVKCGKGGANELFPQCEGGSVVARPFIEFRWANLYRDAFPLENIYKESDQAQVAAFEAVLDQVLEFSLSGDNEDMEGYNLRRPQFTSMVSIDKHGCVYDDDDGPSSRTHKSNTPPLASLAIAVEEEEEEEEEEEAERRAGGRRAAGSEGGRRREEGEGGEGQLLVDLTLDSLTWHLAAY